MSEAMHSPATTGIGTPKIPKILPHERVFPIQIGCELFKLSGASISSDAPSYFSQYFVCQIAQAEHQGDDPSSAVRTLYIDRDPDTFKDISLHLQGYHVTPRDGTHFVRLFADAQFYSLPRLISQLYDGSIFMSIGHREFKIPRDLFTDSGNSPNFFSLGFAVFFSNPEDLFPGLDREGLIRPPPILPPSVPNRSPEIFAELLHLLGGYPVEIRSDAHRQSLLRDCRYFNFKGLEQRLVPHHISFNQLRQRAEIVMRLEDILKSGITILPEPTQADGSAAWINYARPYADSNPCELVLEIGGENTKLHLQTPRGPVANQPSSPAPPGSRASPSLSSVASHSPGKSHTIAHSVTATSNSSGPPPTSAPAQPPSVLISGRAEFFRDVRTRITKLLEVIATKLSLPPRTQPLGLLMASGGAGSQAATPGKTAISDDLVRIVIEPETSITLDGRPFDAARFFGSRASTTAEAVHVGIGEEEQGASNGCQTQTAPGEQHAHQNQSTNGNQGGSRKRRRLDVPLGWKSEEWVVKTGQWRLRIQGGKTPGGVECVLVAVKLDAYTGELARNSQRGFLNA